MHIMILIGSGRSGARMRLALTGLFCLSATPLLAQDMILPGKWESKGTVQAMKFPGMPPEMAKSMAGRTTTTSQCIKPDDLKDVEKKLFKSSDGSCRYTSFKMGSGALSATMACKGEMAMEGVMKGTYTASRYDMTMQLRGSNGMAMDMQTTGRRLGAC